LGEGVFAASEAGSTALSSTSISGITPFPLISFPPGVKYLLVVSLRAVPSLKGITVWTEPLPKDFVPIIIARL
jgi:hypothetical protein